MSATSAQPIDVAVLGGGPSAEHDVSLRSAAAVVAALDRSRWRVLPVTIDRRGRWHVGTAAAVGPAGSVSGDGPPRSGKLPGAALARLIDEHGVGLVFPALHGIGGEDGSLQGMLDLHGVAYVGSGVTASAIGIDKIRTRETLVAHGVPMSRAWVAEVGDRVDPAEIAAAVGLPCFLKTDRSGSSHGVARAASVDEIAGFVAAIGAERFLAEAALTGEEISVAVLGNRGGALQTLTPVGIRPLGGPGWFDIETKYVPGRCEESVPPRDLDESMLAAVRQLALTCHRALGCDGVSRTDMIVTAEGPRVLEVNTLPGLTPESLLPKCAAHDGLPFPALLDRLLDLALERRGALRV